MSEKIKNYLGVAGIVALLLGGFAAWRYVSAYAKSIQPSNFRSFTVSGEGKITAIPDVAQFSFQVITEGGKDIQKLQNDNSTKTNNAIALIKSKGVEDKDIKTENYNLSPRYSICNPGSDAILSAGGACPPSEIVGYTITQSVSVKIRDFKKIGEVLGGVAERGVNSVSGLSFTIDDRTMLENEARGEAIAQAKEKAKDLAKAGGFRVGRLLSIYDQGTPPVPYYGYGMGGDASLELRKAAVAPTIEPGSQEVYVTVSLSYEIE